MSLDLARKDSKWRLWQMLCIHISEMIINNAKDKEVKNKNGFANGTANTCTFNLEFLALQTILYLLLLQTMLYIYIYYYDIISTTMDKDPLEEMD